MYVWETVLKLGCTSEFAILFLVMEFDESTNKCVQAFDEYSTYVQCIFLSLTFSFYLRYLRLSFVSYNSFREEVPI